MSTYHDNYQPPVRFPEEEETGFGKVLGYLGTESGQTSIVFNVELRSCSSYRVKELSSQIKKTRVCMSFNPSIRCLSATIPT